MIKKKGFKNEKRKIKQCWEKSSHNSFCFIFNEKKEMLIIKKSDPAYSKKYSVVDGHVEDGETIEDALLREVFEEMNLNVSEYELIAEFENLNDTCRYGVSFHDWHVFKINHKIEIEKINFDKEEIESLQWMDINEIQKNKEFFTSGSKSMLSALNIF